MGGMLKIYCMYDRTPPDLYCIIRVDAECDYYRVHVSKGEVERGVQPYAHRQSDSHLEWHDDERGALKAAEALFRELKLKGWHRANLPIDP